ncbi:MAG: zeta toxin family protein [Acidobacteriota bacterium]
MSAASQAPVCRIIAGPNGAGKTTFALKYLPEVAPGMAFVNADLIAAGLSPLAPEQQLLAASRLFLQQIELHVAEGRDFAFETTLSGRGYLRLVRRLKSAGWRVELLYLALPNVEMSRLRVAERVAHGGHSIAPADIVRRFPRSLRNLFDLYAGAVDETTCLLNSGPLPEIVFVQQDGERAILQPLLYHQLVKAANP